MTVFLLLFPVTKPDDHFALILSKIDQMWEEKYKKDWSNLIKNIYMCTCSRIQVVVGDRQ